MRIIAGLAKGRRIITPEGMDTRPTSDRVKESIFGILHFKLPGTRVLDLFAGSGNLGLESLSRGASSCVFIDKDGRAVQSISQNVKNLGFEGKGEIVQADFAQAIRRLRERNMQFDFIFMDPPYAAGVLQEAVKLVLENSLLCEEGIIIAEHAAGQGKIDTSSSEIFDVRTYGSTQVSFIRKAEKMRVCVYPGSFDPITSGHLDVVKRSALLFDRVVVAILKNTEKTGYFTVEDRLAFITKAVEGIPNVEVDTFGGLLVDYVKQKDIRFVVRGLRAVSDFEYEFQMAATNKTLYPDVETVFLMPSPDYFYLSSSIVREVGRYGGPLKGMVPECLEAILKERLSKK